MVKEGLGGDAKGRGGAVLSKLDLRGQSEKSQETTTIPRVRVSPNLVLRYLVPSP